MDESLEAFLTRLNLSQYFDNFREAGFDDLETAVTLSEEELEQSVGIVLPGHKRKLSLNFEKLSYHLLLLSLLNQVKLSWESQGNYCRQNLNFKAVN